jgi:hypothetical protein
MLNVYQDTDYEAVNCFELTDMIFCDAKDTQMSLENVRTAKIIDHKC